MASHKEKTVMGCVGLQLPSSQERTKTYAHLCRQR